MLDKVQTYTLKNEQLTVEFLNFGGTITRISLNELGDRNLVSSYERLEDLLNDKDCYINSLVAPVAGRIAYATYNDGSKDVHLSKDAKGNHLHGGAKGISFQLFDVEMISSEEAVLTLKTNHKADGFVGEFDYKVIYKLEESDFSIEYLCVPSEVTILNMTSHLYFNFNGTPQEPIYNHDLQIISDERMQIHPDNFPGNITAVVNDGYDFNTLRNLGEVLNGSYEEVNNARGVDTPYLIKGDTVLQNEDVKLTIKTDAECGVFYTANYFTDQMVLNDGHRGQPHASIAIETQDMPNAINVSKDPKYLYSSDHPYTQKTHYIFEMRNL